MTDGADRIAVVEKSVWFGSSHRRLFGSITAPRDGFVRGGVLLAAPIGRDQRAAHRAYRQLAKTLAAERFLCLRFDYEGTGDSSGMLDDPHRDEAWSNDIESACAMLRSLGVADVAAVGLRFGATLLGAAAATRGLGLSSLVLWDPCESGRTFLRELVALESLRRETFDANADGSIETVEFVFTARTAQEIQSVNLAAVAAAPLAKRVLVIEREARALPVRLRTRLGHENATWLRTTEQEAFLCDRPFDAQLPTDTMKQVADWLSSAPKSAGQHVTLPTAPPETLLQAGPSGELIRERVVRLGPNELFGIVCEPVEAAGGPWIVMLSPVNEHRIGPSRQWVELSRRWAVHGLRSLRLDVRGTGDSPPLNGDREGFLYEPEWLDDVPDALRAISPDDPSNVVAIGLCSGAYAAIEAALALQIRGVCAVNPILDIDWLHRRRNYGDPRRKAVRAMPPPLQALAVRHRRVARGLWRSWRELRPSADPVDILARMVRSGTDLVVLSGLPDMQQFEESRYWRWIGKPRLERTNRYRVEAVPALDHSMHTAAARQAAITAIYSHVVERFAPTRPATGETRRADDLWARTS